MVFCGEFWSGASGTGLADGFRTLGWLVQEIDQGYYSSLTGGKFLLRAIGRLTRHEAQKLYQQRLLDECRKLRPDIFMTIKGIGVTREILKEIKSFGIKTVLLYPDCDFEHKGVDPDSFDEYDLFVTTKSFHLPWLRTRLPLDRIAYVPHAYSYTTHVPPFEEISEESHAFDILYAGNYSPYKESWLTGLAAFGGEMSIAIAGGGWDEFSSEPKHHKIKLLGTLENVSYATAIQSSRINVAFHYGPNKQGWQDLVSTRTFEIPACGGFMLHIDNDEIREFFKPGIEIDVFSSLQELREKIDFYLAHPRIREKMKIRAYQRCTTEHSYRNRAVSILHKIYQ